MRFENGFDATTTRRQYLSQRSMGDTRRQAKVPKAQCRLHSELGILHLRQSSTGAITPYSVFHGHPLRSRLHTTSLELAYGPSGTSWPFDIWADSASAYSTAYNPEYLGFDQTGLRSQRRKKRIVLRWPIYRCHEAFAGSASSVCWSVARTTSRTTWLWPRASSCIHTDASRVLQFPETRQSNAFGWRSYLGYPAGSEEILCYAAPARAGDLSGLEPAFIVAAALDLFLEENIQYAMFPPSWSSIRAPAMGSSSRGASVPLSGHRFPSQRPMLAKIRRSCSVLTLPERAHSWCFCRRLLPV
jgi:hypothetical protein